MKKNSKVIIDFIMYFIGTIIPMFVGLFSVPIMTRYFTPAEYGVMSIVDVTFHYFNCLTFAVLSSICWRFYYNYKITTRLSFFFNFLFSIFLIYTLVISIFTFVFIMLEADNHVKYLIILKFLVVVLSGWVSVEMIVLRHNGESIKYSLISSLITVASFIVLYCLTYVFKLRNEAVYVSSIIIYLVVFCCFYTRRKYRLINLLKHKGVLKEFLSFAYFNIITSFLAVVLTSSDRYMIRYYFSDYNAVGIYEKAYNIGEKIIYSLGTMFFNVYNPIIYKSLSEKRSETTESVFKKIIVLYILFLLPITLVFSLFSKHFVKILLGTAFQTGYVIIPFVAFGYFFDRFTCSLFGVAINFRDVRYNFVGTAMAAVINIFLNFLLIKKYGILGASLSTFVSYFFIFLYSIIVSGFFRLKYYFINKYFNLCYCILLAYTVAHFIIKYTKNESLKILVLNAVFFAVLYYFFIFICIKNKHIEILKSDV